VACFARAFEDDRAKSAMRLYQDALILKIFGKVRVKLRLT
jgi:hypothetical protein